MNLSRRTFITSAALAPVACGGLSYEHGTPVAQPKPLPMVRPPQVGQEWTYIKKDIFNGKTLEVINERVASVGATIVLERSTANGIRLPDEIQSSWGMVSTDPQWPRLLNSGQKRSPPHGQNSSTANTVSLDILNQEWGGKNT
jgi:hypothetical protein